MSSTTVKTDHAFDSVCAAIRDVHDEASLWKLSDELAVVAPAGVEAVEKVVAQAKVRGIPTKSANTLRLYRDVAIRFPVAERVPMVSFSAHREAIVLGDAKQAKQVLADLAKQHGAEGVTVTTVKTAVQAITGKVTPPKPAKGAAGSAETSYADIARDLSKDNGKKFIAALDAMTALSGVTLDSLHAGLTSVLTAIESAKAKAARKAAAEKAKAAPASSKPITAKPSGSARPAPTARPSSRPAATTAKGKGKGDLRDL